MIYYASQQYIKKEQLVQIPLEDVLLDGNLTVPENSSGLVIFAHGSGSSRHSPRNRYVADVLNQHRLATLLTDLLSPVEEAIDIETRLLRFDIPMLAGRLVEIANWVKGIPELHKLKIGFFGSSTGGGAALIAAANIQKVVKAVVSRGGRPDLALDFLPKVTAPTLLIVGERDPEVIKLNEKALHKLNEKSVLEIIPGATHLFEESGTLEKVANLAASWFEKHLG
jgi:dienelactone hydrolase